MHHQTDTLHDSNYFQIFPTLIAMYDLSGYHPSEEPKVKKFISKEIEDTRSFLDDHKLYMLKNHINDCLKAYSNEYGAQYFEVKDSWYTKLPTGASIAPTSYTDDLFVGYYFPNSGLEAFDLIVQAPFESNVQVPSDKSVSIYTAKTEKILIDQGRLLIAPGSITQELTENKQNDADVVMFNVKPCN